MKSGHSCGKDWLAARLALWFHVAYYPSKVIVTGPTERQVRQIVWGEIKAAYQGARLPIGGELLETMLKSGDPQHFMIGFTARDPEAFQGFHSENICVIVTEAPGVEPRLWPAIESLLTSSGQAKLMAIGNATYEPDSEFYAMFTRNASLYRTFTLDSERSPYCSKEWIQEMRAEHGTDGPVYLARVKGIFPEDVADTLIPLAWMERAQGRWSAEASLTHVSDVTLGVDVARFGSDLTVFVKGCGIHFKVVEARQGQDLMETAGRIARLVEEGIDAAHVRVDDTGLGGGVTDRLHEQGKRIRAINFGAAASDADKFANARSEIFWHLRERFRTGEIAIDPRDQKLVRDLSVLRYKMTSKGQIKLEEKAEAKRRLTYSPDRADALALAAMPAHVADAVAAKGKPGWGFLELAREYARAEAEKKSEKKLIPTAVSARPATEIPGASEVLTGAKDAESWRSVS